MALLVKINHLSFLKEIYEILDLSFVADYHAQIKLLENIYFAFVLL